MPSLEELQKDICDAICVGDDTRVSELIAGDGMDPASRLRIYRNHAVITLTDALKATYPVVCRLVSDRFFAYAAHEFIREHLPEQPNLAEYGAEFPGFLAQFPPCHDLGYIADIARLEWAINQALHADNVAAIARGDLSGISSADAPRLVLTMHPGLRLVESRWPVERIWRANQADGDPDLSIDLDSGGVRLQVHRRGDRVMLKSLSPCEFAFLQALARGDSLADAADIALRLDLLFDLAAALGTILEDGIVTGFRLQPPSED
ncbi:MAG TPA: DNA-binding domain-containing protein [Stellaceae bacterium]|nr:DNA-binding domain-containing protein [Stellaceae bacterium]